MSFPLDPAPQDMQAMGEAAVSYLIAFIQGLDEAPAEATEGALDLAHRLRAAPPEHGGEFAPVFAEAQEAISRTFEYAGPGYLAYIPGGGLYTAALADFIAQGVNRYVGLWQPSPAVVQIEENVTRWLCDLFDYPEGSQGLLLSGGSMANLSAMVTARHAKLGEDFTDGVYYVSEQAHASVPKAATIAGFSKRNVRIVVTDDELRMDPEALRTQIAHDRADGLRPFLVAPSVGTTNTGAIDPIADIADIAEAEDLWLHVDGAYGGFFQLTDRGRERFRGTERSDSVTLDPHKGLFLPYGTGGLVVRDGAAMRDAHYEGAAYLQDLPPTGELPNYSEHSAELSRDWRGLRVWMPLALHGVSAFREALDEKLDLATYLADAFRDDDRIELCWEPQLTVIPFRLAGADDDTQREFLARINASKRVFLSSTMIAGRYVLRVCIVSHRTHKDRIDECIEIVGRAADELRA
ncbi:MAG TPA: aminotransferase class V-fold PLP-dependent enzyme [Actinomycetota bacterium]|jgi:aromatic-L-amino-acid decarboxylase|nr:aminotransferase class V-fold PLP-dependent enzyme [Actinomycetota bacterium]